MSFEFDPNKNLNRSEDGNDPQDIKSLGGEGGLFGRVPGRPRVGAANRSQGQAHGGPGPNKSQPLGGQGQPKGGKGQDQGLPLDYQGPLLGRQGQAQARGGLGQTQGGQALGSARQAQGLLGMVGGIPSHVSLAASAASASILGPSSTKQFRSMPVGSFVPSMLVEPMAHVTLLVIRRLLPRLSPILLLRQSTSMLKMQEGKPQTSMQTSSPNMQGILPRSRPSSGV